MMRTLLMTASLLTLAVLGAPPAAACTSPLGPTGEPGGGVLGYTEWYARADADSACAAESAVEASAGQEAGQAQAATLAAVNGAGNLVDASGLQTAASNYANAARAALQSQVFDTCAPLIGPTDPPCQTDLPVSQAQWCAVAIPHAVGGIVGDTTDNSNGLLQATCQFAGAPGGALPSETEVNGFVAAATAAAGVVATTPLDVALGAVDASADFGNAALVNTCVWLADNPACLTGL